MEKRNDLSEEARKQMIYEVLSRQGLSQQDLASLLGRSLRTVQSWISKESIPEVTFEEAIQIRDALDCTLEELAIMFPGRSKRREAIRKYARANPRNRKGTQDK
jgi:transcriptional regulator with XRE-family HTH domain